MPDFAQRMDVSKYAEETEKLWKKINMKQLLTDYFKSIPDEGMNIAEQIQTDNELTGATLFRIDSPKPMYYVHRLNDNTTCSPPKKFLTKKPELYAIAFDISKSVIKNPGNPPIVSIIELLVMHLPLKFKILLSVIT